MPGNYAAATVNTSGKMPREGGLIDFLGHFFLIPEPSLEACLVPPREIHHATSIAGKVREDRPTNGLGICQRAFSTALILKVARENLFRALGGFTKRHEKTKNVSFESPFIPMKLNQVTC